MNHSVTNAGNGDLTSLVFLYDKFSISAMFISACIQISKKPIEIVFKIILKYVELVRYTFPFSKFKPTMPNIF